jgi:hypothetical protein
MFQTIKRLNIDAAIAMTLLQRGWGVFSGLAMVLITSTLFTPQMQGYYYTFNSLIALQAFFELGLNFVLVQFVSHDAAHFNSKDEEKRQSAMERIGLLYRSVSRWFLIPAILFALAVGIGGIVFLGQNEGALSTAEWVGAWALIVLAASINLYFSPQLAMAEGAGKVAAVARLRIFQSVVGYSACWAVIAIRPSLYAVACIGMASALSTKWWLDRHSGLPAIAAGVSSSGRGYQWRKDILPLQWRIGLSWMSGYLLYQLFTPLTFAHQGAAQAAMIGLSMAMFSNISLIAMSWLSASTPALSVMVARSEGAALRRRFKALFLQSLGFQIVASIGLCLVIYLGRRLGLGIMDRFLPASDLVLLGLTACCNLVIFAMATFMRVHKEEPMLWNSLICGLLVAGTAFVTSFWSLTYMLSGYLVVIALISLPWAFLLFLSYWKRDRSAPLEAV